MESSPYIVEARPENFQPSVPGNSREGPVVVFYWSPNAGACIQLVPRLVKLADEFGGRFLLALLDTDEHKTFANEFAAALATLHDIRQAANAPLRHRAKRGMLAVLALLGPEHRLAGKYQALLRQ